MKQIPPSYPNTAFHIGPVVAKRLAYVAVRGSCWHCYHCVSCSTCQLPLFYSPCPPRRTGETSATSRPDDRQLLSARGCYGRPFMAQRKPVSAENHNGPTTHQHTPFALPRDQQRGIVSTHIKDTYIQYTNHHWRGASGGGLCPLYTEASEPVCTLVCMCVWELTADLRLLKLIS
jgi:hypothetical protein